LGKFLFQRTKKRIFFPENTSQIQTHDHNFNNREDSNDHIYLWIYGTIYVIITKDNDKISHQ
jgi:hypothetical protein